MIVARKNSQRWCRVNNKKTSLLWRLASPKMCIFMWVLDPSGQSAEGECWASYMENRWEKKKHRLARNQAGGIPIIQTERWWGLAVVWNTRNRKQRLLNMARDFMWAMNMTLKLLIWTDGWDCCFLRKGSFLCWIKRSQKRLTRPC